MGGGGQGGCERRISAFVKIKKKNVLFFLGGGLTGVVRLGRGGGAGWECPVGCDRSIEVFGKVFGKIHPKKNSGGGGGGWFWG